MLDLVCDIVILMLLAGMAVAFVRIVRGPSLCDRVVALDMVATIVVGMILTYCVQSGEAVYLPAAIGMALLAFVGTVALALYIRKGGPP